MKFAIVLLIVAAVVGCALSCNDDSWSDYKKTEKKVYPTEEEELRRRDIYCQNLKKINEHNELYARGESTYEMGVNQFTDWTSDEFVGWVGRRNGLLRQ